MKIKINNTDSIDLPKLIAGKLLVQANSGGGKSWLIRRLVEQAYGKVQIIILDPEGEFLTLREKFDFVLAGKGGDTPADQRTATLLARKALEHGFNLIVDLYELHPQERKHFVRLFLESMVNAPKELYHDTLVVLDEAHMFAPEKGESEALGSVIDMASRGRKRGYSLVLATQRISKLHKDAAAECNNKLIGRTSLDIDRKRAADELGITNKEEVLALRTLQPGEFFAFGPAISNEVVKIKVGEVETSIPKAGSMFKVAPASAAVMKVLEKLADLPAEAKQEAQTVADLKAEIRELKKHTDVHRFTVKQTYTPDPTAIERAVKIATAKVEKERFFERGEFLKHIHTLYNAIETIGKSVQTVLKTKETAKVLAKKDTLFPLPKDFQKLKEVKITVPQNVYENKIDAQWQIMAFGTNDRLPGPEQKILDAISWMVSIDVPQPDKGVVAFVAGYSSTSSSYTNSVSALRTKGLIAYPSPGLLTLTREGMNHTQPPERNYTNEDLHEKIYAKLAGPERKILEALIAQYPNEMSTEELAEATGYSSTSSSFTNSKSRVRSLGFAEYPQPNRIKAAKLLFPNQ